MERFFLLGGALQLVALEFQLLHPRLEGRDRLFCGAAVVALDAQLSFLLGRHGANDPLWGVAPLDCLVWTGESQMETGVKSGESLMAGQPLRGHA